jgi:hypothetical protein
VGSGNVCLVLDRKGKLMPTFLYNTLEIFAGIFDLIRARLLRITLTYKPLRPFFYVRSRRLYFLFMIAYVMALIFSMWIPLWILLVGPLVYGVPHIVSSVRYFDHTVRLFSNFSNYSRKPNYSILLLSILTLVFGYRILVTANILQLDVAHISEWSGSTYVELTALFATFFWGCIYYSKKTVPILRGILLLIPLFFSFYYFMAWTVAVLVLVHNFVAFIYWIIAAKSDSEKNIAKMCFLITILTTDLIFFGLFDFVCQWLKPRLDLDFVSLSIRSMGSLILPDFVDEKLWLRACIAFAFGQSLHYFVWLKAIPDQWHYHEVPTSFKQSLRFLKDDFGRGLAIFIIVVVVGSFFVWSFVTFEQARIIYFCFAAYHGYLEIAGLSLCLEKSDVSSYLRGPPHDSQRIL